MQVTLYNNYYTWFRNITYFMFSKNNITDKKITRMKKKPIGYCTFYVIFFFLRKSK